MEQFFVVVKDGMVQEVFSTMAPNEVVTEILDMDSDCREEKEERALQFRYEAIRELMYRLY